MKEETRKERRQKGSEEMEEKTERRYDRRGIVEVLVVTKRTKQKE